MRRDEMDEQEIDELLAHLDDPAPQITAQQIIDAARGSDGRAGVSLAGRRAAARASRLKWAAGIVLASGVAGAAYAAPGSPLRGWLDALRGSADVEPTEEVDLEAPPAPAADPSGIAVDPGQALTISFEVAQPDGTLTVVLTDASEVVVRATGGDRAPGFTSGLDRLVIDNRASSADVAIEVPRRAPSVQVLVGGRRALLSEGGRVTTEASPGPDGRYVLPWTGG